jgi:hypothetical protein
LKFAKQLVAVKSEDEAITVMNCNNQGLAAFMVAAHFAFPYLAVATDPANLNRLRHGPPYVALAEAVAEFLSNLKSESRREQ